MILSKRIPVLLVIFLFCYASLVNAQEVSGIRTEQTGDFIRISYQILNSTPDQVFKVRVLCSINGGLNAELRSVSGDMGDHVPGGRAEYWIVWDVLKDVDEISSAEFTVRAELVSGKPSVSGTVKPSRDRGQFMAGAVFETPGPKFGARLAYLGAVGLTLRYTTGTASMDPSLSIIPDLSDDAIHGETIYSAGISVRLFHTPNFKMHLFGSFALSKFTFFEDVLGSSYYDGIDAKGFEAGMILNYKMFSLFGSFTHFDPGQVEKSTDLRCWNALSYYDIGLGLCF
ncbi:MAG: hypothetical protein ACOYXB_12315 [Bacteroidota bacterium]